jgi:hypothetical protein
MIFINNSIKFFAMLKIEFGLFSDLGSNIDICDNKASRKSNLFGFPNMKQLKIHGI